MLKVEIDSCGYKNNIILKNVSFKAALGEIVCLLGPNGSGKSTLIKTIVGLLEPIKGKVMVDNIDMGTLSWKEKAKLISYIPQVFNSAFRFRALDIVLMGRTSYLSFGALPSEGDERIALEAMETLKISHLKNKIYSMLSGGERQLVKIAQALAQQTKIIIMDEPTNNLDFGYQITMLSHLQKCADMGILIIMATHSPEQVFSFGTKAILIKDGGAKEIVKPQENLTEKELKDLYKTRLAVVELNINNSNRKICLPIF